MKTLVLGIGNTILGDDGVGVLIVRQLSSRMRDSDIIFKETAAAGLNLLDIILGFDRLILVDAVLADDDRIGKVFHLNPGDLQPSSKSISAHSCGLTASLELGRKLYQSQIPQTITIFAVGIHEVSTVSESLTPKIAAAIPEAVEMVCQELRLEQQGYLNCHSTFASLPE